MKNHKGPNNPSWKGGIPNCEVCGKKLSDRKYKICNHCNKLGIKNSMFGKHISEETKAKTREKLSGNRSHLFKTGDWIKQYYCSCGNKISVITALRGKKHCIKCASIGKNNSRYIDGRTSERVFCVDCGKRISCAATRCKPCSIIYIKLNGIFKGKNNGMYGKRGKKAPSWNGGSSFYPYNIQWRATLKEKIRNRDKNTCVLCNTSNYKHLKNFNHQLHVHHIDYDKNNCRKDNLITLCQRCHAKTNFNRDYWYAYFKYKTSIKIKD